MGKDWKVHRVHTAVSVKIASTIRCIVFRDQEIGHVDHFRGPQTIDIEFLPADGKLMNLAGKGQWPAVIAEPVDDTHRHFADSGPVDLGKILEVSEIPVDLYIDIAPILPEWKKWKKGTGPLLVE